MTVTNTINRTSYDCNGSTTSFSTIFVFLSNADVVVTLVAPNGTKTVLTLNTHYSLTGAGSGVAGQITTSTTYAAGYKLIIDRKPALTQQFNMQDGSGFPASNVNKAFDKAVMIDQYLQTQITDLDGNLHGYAASNSYVNAQLATKAANSYVNAQINAEKGRAASNNYVNSQLALKANITFVDSQMAAERGRAAANTYVNSQINLEKGRAAANTYVNAQINLEKGRAAANSYVNSQFNIEKGRAASNTYVNAQLATKAGNTYLISRLNTEIGRAASNAYVNTQLGTKAANSFVVSQLATKAANSYVNSQLALKANTSQYSSLVTVVAGKASLGYAAANSYVNSQLNLEKGRAAANTYVVSEINAEKGRAAANTYVVDQVNTLKGYAASNAYVNSLAFGTIDAGDVTNTYLQTVLSPLVTGPGSASNNGLVAFDGTTGKLVKQAGTITVGQGGTGAVSFPAYSMLVANGSSALVPTKPLTAGQIVVGITSGTPRAISVSGDATLASSGILTVTKTNGSTFSTVATSGSYNDLSNKPVIASANGYFFSKSVPTTNPYGLQYVIENTNPLTANNAGSTVAFQMKTGGNTGFAFYTQRYNNQTIFLTGTITNPWPAGSSMAFYSPRVEIGYQAGTPVLVANSAGIALVQAQLLGPTKINLGASIDYIDKLLVSNTYFNSIVPAKASNSYVNTQLGTKAANSYVNTQLGAKANTSMITATIKTAAIGCMINGGGQTITTGVKGAITVPFNCTINEWTLMGDQTGSITVTLWRDTLANYPPTSGDNITASAPLTISSAQSNRSSTLTGWTTAVNAGDVIFVNVSSVTSLTWCSLSLKVTRT